MLLGVRYHRTLADKFEERCRMALGGDCFGADTERLVVHVAKAWKIVPLT
jgi:hypothetical protein